MGRGALNVNYTQRETTENSQPTLSQRVQLQRADFNQHDTKCVKQQTLLTRKETSSDNQCGLERETRKWLYSTERKGCEALRMSEGRDKARPSAWIWSVDCNYHVSESDSSSREPPRDADTWGGVTAGGRSSHVRHTDDAHGQNMTSELTWGQVTTKTWEVSSRLFLKTISRLHLINNFH